MTTVATREDKQVARPLRVLVPLIKEDLKHADEAAQSAGMPYYKAAGEKMIEAKSQLETGQLEPWIKRNFRLSLRQARLYISYAKTTQGGKRFTPAYTSMDDFRRRHLGEQRIPGSQRDKAWQEPIKDIMSRAQENANRLAQENLNRAEEREAQRKLALQLIDIGFKALAAKFHPDKGGNRDAMTRLNLVRARLKASA